MTDTKDAIQEAALTLFATKGFDAVGVMEIVDAAEVSKPTLYHHFGSKFGLMRAVCDAGYRRLVHRLSSEVTYGGDLRRSLETILREMMKTASRESDFFYLRMAILAAPPSHEVAPLAQRYEPELEAFFQEIFVSAIPENGNLKGHEKLLAASFLAQCDRVVTRWMATGKKEDRALARRIVKLFMHGIYSL